MNTDARHLDLHNGSNDLPSGASTINIDAGAGGGENGVEGDGVKGGLECSRVANIQQVE